MKITIVRKNDAFEQIILWIEEKDFVVNSKNKLISYEFNDLKELNEFLLELNSELVKFKEKEVFHGKP